jgi:hypothetical protein
MTNVLDKIVEKIETHNLGSIKPFSENPAVYEIMWTNMIETDRVQMKL